MKAVMKYPGSKWSLAGWIISMFPKHHSYLEPFFGSGAVLFNKARSDIETVNDLDGNVVNLFECIRTDPERLAGLIHMTPYAREVYEKAFMEIPEEPFEKAVNFYIRLNMGHGFRTNGERVGWRNDIQGRERAYAARDWCMLPDRVIQAAERLRGVQIENKPAGMKMHLDACNMAILDAVIVKAVQNVEMTETTTLPATLDDTNQYIMSLFDTKKAPKLSPNTVEFYKSTLNEFMALVSKPLNKICESDVEYYLLAKKSGNSNAYLNNLRRNLSAFFTWMRKEKIISENPCDGIELYTAIEKPIDHMDATDVERLKLGCVHKRDRALIEFMRSTAMRRGEVPLVKVCDIDFRSGKLTIFGKKTQKYRTVFLDDVAIHYIREYLGDRGVPDGSREPLFTHLRGDKTKALDVDGIYSSIRDIARRAGMDRRIYPHLFRKTTTNICRRGGSEDAAGEYLGHAPRNVTGKHYTYKGDGHVEQIFHNYVEAV